MLKDCEKVVPFVLTDCLCAGKALYDVVAVDVRVDALTAEGGDSTEIGTKVSSYMIVSISF